MFLVNEWVIFIDFILFVYIEFNIDGICIGLRKNVLSFGMIKKFEIICKSRLRLLFWI